MELATTPNPKELEPSRHSPMSPMETQPSLRLPLLRDQSPSLLRPIRPLSSSTKVELLPVDAEPSLTMVSSPLDTEPRTEKDTSLSRTLGALHGEMLDTSRSVMEPKTTAESSLMPLTQLSDYSLFANQISSTNDQIYLIFPI
jgi:hypothetical protein